MVASPCSGHGYKVTLCRSSVSASVWLLTRALWGAVLLGHRRGRRGPPRRRPHAPRHFALQAAMSSAVRRSVARRAALYPSLLGTERQTVEREGWQLRVSDGNTMYDGRASTRRDVKRSQPSRPATRRRPTADCTKPNENRQQTSGGRPLRRALAEGAGGGDAGPGDPSQRYDAATVAPRRPDRRPATNSGRERRRPSETKTNDDTTPAAVADGARVKTHLIWSIANEQQTPRRQSPRASGETNGETTQQDGPGGVYRHAAGFSVMCEAWRMLLVASWPGDSSMASLDLGPPTAAVGFCSITAGRWLRGGACDTMS